MIPILSIVGKSNSGKTFLVERLVARLTRKGYRIATIKHNAHGFDIDREGKDSWRHKQAGSSTVILSSAEKIAIIKDVEEEYSLGEIRSAWVRDVDLIVAEGYKRSEFPKIEVALFRESEALICTPEDRLIAVVTDRDFSVEVPVFRRAELDALADWVEGRFLGPRNAPLVEVAIAGRPIPLNRFVQRMAWNMWRGFLASLKGWDPQGTAEVKIYGSGSNQAPVDDGGGSPGGEGN